MKYNVKDFVICPEINLHSSVKLAIYYKDMTVY